MLFCLISFTLMLINLFLFYSKLQKGWIPSWGRRLLLTWVRRLGLLTRVRRIRLLTRVQSLESVEHNYAPLLETLEDISTGSDSGISSNEERSKAAGIFCSMQTFNTFFCVMLGVKFYGITDILNLARKTHYCI